MPTPSGTNGIPTRWRAFASGAFVVLTVLAVWKFIDYRTQPPPPPAPAVAAHS